MKTVKIATVSGEKKDCIAYVVKSGLAITKATIAEVDGALVYAGRYRITHLESGHSMFEVGKLKQAKELLTMLLQTGFDFTQPKEVVGGREHRGIFSAINQTARERGWYN